MTLPAFALTWERPRPDYVVENTSRTRTVPVRLEQRPDRALEPDDPALRVHRVQ